MKFCHVTIPVKSLDESLRFYKDIMGLSVSRQFPAGPGMEIAFLRSVTGSGETEVELIYNEGDNEACMGTHISLGFEVDSLHETIELLQLKNINVGEIVQLGAQAKCVFITDPNGVRIQLVEYLK